MKILIYAHRLEFGGTQVNAIELAAALRDIHGHDVVLFATPGPMIKLAEQKGVRCLAAPEAQAHPSPARMDALRRLVRHERPDLLHVWDWPQCLDAYYAVYLPKSVPMVVTDMTMDLNRVLPKTLPTTFGTPELVDKARAAGRRQVKLILPPVDIHLNKPGVVDVRPFSERYCIQDSDITLVTVSRLTDWMKSESLRRTIDVVRTLGRDLPLRFIVVGDGTSRVQLERLANETNNELGRAAVVLTGALLDPRPAYAAADIVVGMGGSALRGMAFGKPTVIVGEQGFSATFSPETAESFYYKGMYGLGDGSHNNASLIANIRGLGEHPDQLSALGEFSRQFLVQHYSLETVCAQLEKFCRAAVGERRRPFVAPMDGLRTLALFWFGRFTPDWIRRLVKNHELKKPATASCRNEPRPIRHSTERFP